MIKYANHEELSEFCCIPTQIDNICLTFVYYTTFLVNEKQEDVFGKPLPKRHEEEKEEPVQGVKDGSEKEEEDVGEQDEEQDAYDTDGVYVPVDVRDTQYDYFKTLEDKLPYDFDDIHPTASDFLGRLEPNLRMQTIIHSAVISENQEKTSMCDFMELHSGVRVYGMERMTSAFDPVAEKYLLPMFQLINWDNPKYLSYEAASAFHGWNDKGLWHAYYQHGTGIECTHRLLKELGYEVKCLPFDLAGICGGFMATMPKDQADKWEKLLREYWAWSDAGCPDLPDRKPIFTHDN